MPMLRIFDYKPLGKPKRARFSVRLPKNTPFCFGVFNGRRLISRHRSFYLAQNARNSHNYLSKYGPKIKIRKLNQ